MPFIETLAEFTARQNCERIQTESTDFQDTYVFANGAGCVLQKMGLTQTLSTREPPTEKFALLHAKRFFVATKLSKEVKDYEAALLDYKERSHNAVRYPHHCTPVPAGALAALQDGWNVIEALRQELKKIDDELSESPEAILARQRRELDERDSANLAARQRTANLFASMSPNGPPPAASQDVTDVVGSYLNKQA